MRKSLAIAAIAFAAISTSACTPEEIAAVVAWHASQTEAVKPDPVQVEVDCNHLSFTITEPEGTNVFIGIGSQPPFGFTVGAEQTWGFINTDGTYTGNIAISGYDSAHSFNWSVDVNTAPAPGTESVRVVEGFVTCPV